MQEKIICTTKRNNLKHNDDLKKKKSNLMEKYVKANIFVELKCHQKRIIYFNQYMKLHKIPHIIYSGMVYIIKKIDQCTNIFENSPTTKIGENIPCRADLMPKI